LDCFSTARYGAVLGHRGFTHSLIFALWVGFLAASLTYRLFRGGLLWLTAIYFLVTSSHGVLDAFTTGGFGIPLFWPITSDRYGPWGPIPVADVGFEIPNPRSSRAIRGELLYVWLPTVITVGLVTVHRFWM